MMLNTSRNSPTCETKHLKITSQSGMKKCSSLKKAKEGRVENRIINFVCLCVRMKLFCSVPSGGREKRKTDKNPLIVSIRIFTLPNSRWSSFPTTLWESLDLLTNEQKVRRDFSIQKRLNWDFRLTDSLPEPEVERTFLLSFSDGFGVK